MEKIRGRPVPFRIMEQSGVLGFMLVAFLFIVGLSNDIGRLTGDGFDTALTLWPICSAHRLFWRGEGMERATVDKTAQPKGVEGTTVAAGLRAHRAGRTRTASRCARAAASPRSPGASTSSRSTASRWACAASA